jgi:acetyl-CoA carboxylase, biotin carboxylase subunit
MQRVLIANRGEIAERILRACHAEGLEAVMVYSQADSGLAYLGRAERAVCIGPPAAAQSYLSVDTILMTALGTGCDAIHPGYGFLSENASFARRCAEHGLQFIGPDAETIELMGDKIAGRTTAERHGVPVVPGSHASLDDAETAIREANLIGYPLLIKATGGGGGRGMRVVASESELHSAISQAQAEAQSAFSNPVVYLERYFDNVHHVEVQVFGDTHGNVIHLGERDCSTQRRHQKLVEESPSSAISKSVRAKLCEDAQRLALQMGYASAGTVEFIYDRNTQQYYFIEMNTRIQVEHPVTEAVTGTDLVREQLRVAAGEPLSLSQDQVDYNGHAIEWRINAEDPTRQFAPSPGRVSRFVPSYGPGIRVDSFIRQGQQLSPYYDSLMAKLIVHGKDRADALARSARALSEFKVEGVSTTIPFHRWLLEQPAFRAGRVHTRWVEEQRLGEQELFGGAA